MWIVDPISVFTFPNNKAVWFRPGACRPSKPFKILKWLVVAELLMVFFVVTRITQACKVRLHQGKVWSVLQVQYVMNTVSAFVESFSLASLAFVPIPLEYLSPRSSPFY